jgi:hypothetical protein
VQKTRSKEQRIKRFIEASKGTGLPNYSGEDYLRRSGPKNQRSGQAGLRGESAVLFEMSGGVKMQKTA